MTGRRGLIACCALTVAAAVTAVSLPARPAPHPSTLAEPAPARGKQVFDTWCADCHAPGPGHPGTQSLEVKYRGELPAALEHRTDLSPEVTAYFVRNGVALMPFFRKTEISDAELEALGAYLAGER